MKSDQGRSGWIDLICRIYARLLHAYPKAFRNQFGGGMQQVFRDRCRAATRKNNLTAFVLRMFGDWLGTSLRERLAALRITNGEIHALLALCGLLDAIYAAVTSFMEGPEGSVILRTSVNNNHTLENMGLLALAAGICTIAAGGLRSIDKSWLVVVNGLACGALGLTLCGAFGFRIGFRTLALLIVIMALSLGIYEVSAAVTLRGHRLSKLLLAAAGAISIGFALAFFAFAFHWIGLGPRPLSDFLWFGAYFGFAALSMLGLALGTHGSGPVQLKGYGSETPLLDVG